MGGGIVNPALASNKNQRLIVEQLDQDKQSNSLQV